MAPTRQRLLDVLVLHEASEGGYSSHEEDEGTAACSCGWEETVWKLDDRCRCSLDDQLGCQCGYEDHLVEVAEANAQKILEMCVAHVADVLADVLAVDARIAAETLMAHRTYFVDNRDESGQTRTWTCSCGFREVVWHIEGQCTCAPGEPDVCDFCQRLTEVISVGDEFDDLDAPADPWVFEHVTDHLVVALS